MKYIILFALLIFCCRLQAQLRLSGSISNSSGTTIGYANVTLNSTDSPQAVTMQADSNGNFVFTGLSTKLYTLTAINIGYTTTEVDISLKRDTVVKLLLSPDSKQLKEVQVNANKMVITNTPDKLVYNVSADITATGSDVLTTIGKMPGVKVGDGGISIAGKGEVKVMVNNQLVRLSGTDLLRYIRSISANQVSKIELLKNPSAAEDAEGNAGLINIVTKQSTKAGWSGNVQTDYKQWLHSPANVFGTSDYWMANTSFSIDYNSSKLSLYASVSADQDHELEGFETDIFYPKQKWLQSDTGNYRYHNVSAIAGFDYKLSPNTSIGASYIGGTNTYDGSDHVNNPVYSSNGPLDSTLRTYATYHPVALSNSVNLHSVIKFDTAGSKLMLNADYFNYYRTDRSDLESNTYLPNGEAIPSSFTRYHDTNKQNINVYTFKADAELPTHIGKLAFGGKVSFINNYSNAYYYNKTANDSLVYSNLSNAFSYKENTQAAYLSLDGEKGKWKYQAGLRGELTQTNGYSYNLQQTNINNYFKLFPSVVATYQADSTNSYSLTFGRRINRPSFWSLNPYKSVYTAYSYSEGNPFLQPEYATNIEVSHTYKTLLTSALFYNLTNNGFTNLTIADANSSLVYTIPLNFIKTYKYGISETLNLQPFSWLDNSETVTAYHTKASSSLAYVNSLQATSLYLASNNNIYFNNSKTLAAAVNLWYQFPEVDHIGLSSHYYKVDMGISALAMDKKLNITLNVNDVFRTSASAVTATVNGIRQTFTNFQLNRFAQITVGYRFGGTRTNTEQETGNEDERSRVH